MTDKKKLSLSRRKMLGGLGAIGLAGAGAGLGTSALFSDEEEFEGNEIQAGELNLVVGYETSVDQDGVDTGSTTGGSSPIGGPAQIDGNPASGEYVINDLKPGDSGELLFCPKIVDNPGWLWVGSVDGVTGFENGQTEPEEDVDDSAGGPNNGEGQGELAEAIEVDVSYINPPTPGAERELNNPDGYTLADLFKELESGFLLDGEPYSGDPSGTQAYPSSPNDTTQNGPCLRIEWEVPASVGNEIQSDSVEFDITFAAVQERNNPDPENPFADATVWPGGSIQSALGSASSGDVISVFGGSFGDGSDYDEALSVDKSLTLARASAEMPVVKDTSGSNIETVSISASDVVFDGFEVTGTSTGPDNQQNAGIRVEAPSSSAISNIQVCNSVVRDILASARATGIGIDADQGPIPNPGANGTINDVEVYNCRVENVSNTDPPASSLPNYPDSRAKGIAMNGRIFDPTVRHATIQNVGDSSKSRFGRGITISEDSTPDPDVGATNFEIVSSEISGMSGAFSSGGTNFGGAAMFIGEYPDFGDHVVENNNLENLVENFPNGTPPQSSTDELNAPNNWWGASDGPSGPGGSGSGVAVTENVDFDPVENSSLSNVGSTV